jgi:hypothetical protein
LNPQECNPKSFIPQGPIPVCGFPTQESYSLGLQAISDAFTLAKSALDELEKNPNGQTFARWFDVRVDGILETVTTVFRAILVLERTDASKYMIPGDAVEL